METLNLLSQINGKKIMNTDAELLKLLTDIQDLCEMWFLRGQPFGHNREDYNVWLATSYHSNRYIRLLDAIDKIKNSEELQNKV